MSTGRDGSSLPSLFTATKQVEVCFAASAVQTRYRFRLTFSVRTVSSVSVSMFLGFFENEAQSIGNFHNRFHP